MNIDTKEFRKYAAGHCHVKTDAIDSYITSVEKRRLPSAITPYITEEREMRVAQMDVFSRLMMDRIIFMGEEVNDTVANVIQAQMLFLQSTDPKKDIHMYINSPGGSVYAGFGIYDTMQLVSPDVCTTCTGMALSMGAVLLCAGAAGKRAALPHSRVMLHQPLGGVQGPASDIEITANQVLKIKKELYEVIAKHSRQDYQKIYEVCDRDYWLTSAEAKDFGVIDEILGSM